MSDANKNDDDGWEDVTEEFRQVDADEPGAFDVQLVLYAVGEKTYGAGRVYVRLGKSDPIPCIAMIAGDERWILPDDLAADWLATHGLPLDEAQRLVACAQGMPNEEVPTKENPAPILLTRKKS